MFLKNEFAMACAFTEGCAVTLPVAMGKTLGQSSMDWGILSASGTLAIISVLILAFTVQRYIVAGLTMGAVKG